MKLSNAGVKVPAHTLALALAWAVSTTAVLSGCETTAGGQRAASELAPPPTIKADMPLNKALEAAIDYGGDTLAEVKRLIKRRNDGAKAAKMLEPALREGIEKYQPHQLLNAGHLLTATPGDFSPALFKDLISAERPLARQLGWQLAAAKPSNEIAAAVDAELTRAVSDNELEAVLMPQMANAVRGNRLVNAYTIVRQGLMSKGDEEFVHAMIETAPERASQDFLTYLALAPAEELRQLTLSSVNLYAVLAIMKHFQKVPPRPSDANLEHLFVYAVSRNTGLAEMAQTVIEGFIPQHTEFAAQLLARHPIWVQIAYLENARRRMSPKVGLLLSELKKATAENDVVREIDEIKF